MPLVEVELVRDEPTPAGLAGALADGIGAVLGAAVGSTWVRVRLLARRLYGESGGALDASTRPVFVTITAHQRPPPADLEAVAGRVTAVVAELTDHPARNVHVIFAPDGAGRIAFGGRLRH